MQRAIVGHYIYLLGIGAVVVARLVPGVAQARPAPEHEAGIIAAFLGVLSLAEYAVSLWLEKTLLTKGPPGQAAAPIVIAYFGVSIAIYGFVAWFLGAPSGWFWGFVGLALLHWFHSALRWSSLPS